MTQTSLSDRDRHRFATLVLSASGLEIPANRAHELDRAVLAIGRETGAHDVDRLYGLLADRDRGDEQLRTLVNALTIGETYFFRGAPLWEALEREVIPALLRARRSERRLRLWSAGCSTGEEPYSLAMLLRRLVDDIGAWDIALLATDINEDSLARAREATYRAWSLRGVDDTVRDANFIAQGDAFRVPPQIRRMVTFKRHNVALGTPDLLLSAIAPFDLILCRNTVMYFGEQIAADVLRSLVGQLADDGWLFIAAPELGIAARAAIAGRNLGSCTGFQRPVSVSSAPQPHTPAAPQPHAAGGRRAERSRSIRPGAVRKARRRSHNVHVAVEPRPRYEDALELFASGRLDDALAVLAELKNGVSRDAAIPLLEARIHADRMSLEEADAASRRAIELDPLLASARYVHGLILQEAGDLESAVDEFRRCIYLEPRFVLAGYALARALARLGERKQATKSIAAVERLLAGMNPAEPLPEGAGLTAGQLHDLISGAHATPADEIAGVV